MNLSAALRKAMAKVVVVLAVPAVLTFRIAHHLRRLFRLTTGKNPDDR
jgi:hypothetical protein